jgi:hypothetical protein
MLTQYSEIGKNKKKGRNAPRLAIFGNRLSKILETTILL